MWTSVEEGQAMAGAQVANRPFEEESSLAYYYREVDRYPQITPGEEIALAARIEAGDEGALDALVKANLRFVIHVARGFRNMGLSMGDLINEGNLGLVTAARRFNRRRECRFVTYAIWWIRQNILKALEVQTRSVRLPANVFNDLSRLRRAEAGLAQDLGRQPTPDEIARRVGFQTSKVNRTLEAVTNPASLDTPRRVGEDEGCLGDALGDRTVPLPDEPCLAESLRRDVGEALKSLSERHRAILSLYYGMETGEPATYQQIGRRMGISRERVRQLKEDAFSKLKQPAVRKRLVEHL
jgi:RNA polymerase primary sigma factor